LRNDTATTSTATIKPVLKKPTTSPSDDVDHERTTETAPAASSITTVVSQFSSRLAVAHSSRSRQCIQPTSTLQDQRALLKEALKTTMKNDFKPPRPVIRASTISPNTKANLLKKQKKEESQRQILNNRRRASNLLNIEIQWAQNHQKEAADDDTNSQHLVKRELSGKLKHLEKNAYQTSPHNDDESPPISEQISDDVLQNNSFNTADRVQNSTLQDNVLELENYQQLENAEADDHLSSQHNQNEQQSLVVNSETNAIRESDSHRSQHQPTQSNDDSSSNDVVEASSPILVDDSQSIPMDVSTSAEIDAQIRPPHSQLVIPDSFADSSQSIINMNQIINGANNVDVQVQVNDEFSLGSSFTETTQVVANQTATLLPESQRSSSSHSDTIQSSEGDNRSIVIRETPMVSSMFNQTDNQDATQVTDDQTSTSNDDSSNHISSPLDSSEPELHTSLLTQSRFHNNNVPASNSQVSSDIDCSSDEFKSDNEDDEILSIRSDESNHFENVQFNMRSSKKHSSSSPDILGSAYSNSTMDTPSMELQDASDLFGDNDGQSEQQSMSEILIQSSGSNNVHESQVSQSSSAFSDVDQLNSMHTDTSSMSDMIPNSVSSSLEIDWSRTQSASNSYVGTEFPVIDGVNFRPSWLNENGSVKSSDSIQTSDASNDSILSAAINVKSTYKKTTVPAPKQQPKEHSKKAKNSSNNPVSKSPRDLIQSSPNLRPRQQAQNKRISQAMISRQKNSLSGPAMSSHSSVSNQSDVDNIGERFTKEYQMFETIANDQDELASNNDDEINDFKYSCLNPCQESFDSILGLFKHVKSTHSFADNKCAFKQSQLKSIRLDGCDQCKTAFLPLQAHQKHKCLHSCTPGSDEDKQEEIQMDSWLAAVAAQRQIVAFEYHRIGWLTNMTWDEISRCKSATFRDMPKSSKMHNQLIFITTEIMLGINNTKLTSNQREQYWKLFFLLPWLLFQFPKDGTTHLSKVLASRLKLYLNEDFDTLFKQAKECESKYKSKQRTPGDPSPQVSTQVDDSDTDNDNHLSANNSVQSPAIVSKSGQSSANHSIVSSKSVINENQEIARTRRVIALSKKGHLSKATSSMRSKLTLADPDKDTSIVAKVQELFPSACQETKQLQNQLKHTARISPSQLLNIIDVRKSLQESKATGAGCSGMQMDFLKLILKSNNAMNALTEMLNNLILGNVPQEVITFLRSGMLTVLQEPGSDKVRPLVVREVLVRLLSRTIAKKEQQGLADHLPPLQTGVGLRSGIEFSMHTARVLLEQNPSWTVIALDCKNAFGTIKRSAIFNALNTFAQNKTSLTRIFFRDFVCPEITIRTRGNITFPCNEGVLQGDPLSSLLFSLALNSALVKAHESLYPPKPPSRLIFEPSTGKLNSLPQPPSRIQQIADNDYNRSRNHKTPSANTSDSGFLSNGHILAYLDDVNIIAPVDAAFKAKDVFVQSAGELGLTLSSQKTQVLLPKTIFSDLQRIFMADKSQDRPKSYYQANERAFSRYVDQLPSDNKESFKLLKSKCQLSGFPQPKSMIEFLGKGLGNSTEVSAYTTNQVKEEDFQNLEKISELSHQIALLLLRVCIGQNNTHFARAMTPLNSAGALLKNDKLVHQTVAMILGGGSLSEKTELEITLPIKDGGLGLQNLHSIRETAYFASVHSMICTWKRYLPDNHQFFTNWLDPPDKGKSPPSLHQDLRVALSKIHERINNSANSAGSLKANSSKSIIASKLPTEVSGLLKFPSVLKLQHKLTNFAMNIRKKYFEDNYLRTQELKAHFKSKSGPNASAFLQTVPSERSLTMTNREMRIALTYYLQCDTMKLLNVPADLACSCGKLSTHGSPIKATEFHALNCGTDGQFNRRHNVLVDTLVEAFQYVGLEPKREVQCDLKGNSVKRYDISVANALTGYNMVNFDLTVKNPLSQACLSKASHSQLSAAETAAVEKNEKYKEFVKEGEIFFPLVLETPGAMHEYLEKIIRSLSYRVGHAAPDRACWTAPNFNSYFFQRISVALQKLNAQAIYNVALKSKSTKGDHPLDGNYFLDASNNSYNNDSSQGSIDDGTTHLKASNALGVDML
jgi:hypothetical protein